MHASTQDLDRLPGEHCTLLREYARAQERCTALLREQAQRIAALDAEVMRLRAAVAGRDSLLAWAREDRAALEREIPGLARRVDLGRRVAALQARIGDLLRERAPRHAGPAAVPATGRAPDHLEASLGAADLVICQTGCLSHGDYWRAQDHCKRTGKACVLVAQPEALRIVRIHGAGAAVLHPEPVK
jgi:uncharacterized small protein (DUF1192 family)